MKAKISTIDTRLATLQWTQGDLARACGRSQPTISELLAKIRNGDDVAPHLVGALATALSVPVEDLSI